MTSRIIPISFGFDFKSGRNCTFNLRILIKSSNAIWMIWDSKIVITFLTPEVQKYPFEDWYNLNDQAKNSNQIFEQVKLDSKP